MSRTPHESDTDDREKTGTVSPKEVHRTASVADAVDIAKRLFHPHVLRPLATESEFRFATSHVTVGPVSIGTLHYARHVRVDTAPYKNWYHVNVPLSGEFRTLVGDQLIEATMSRGAVYGPDIETAFSGFDRPTVMLAVKLDRVAVEAASLRLFEAPARQQLAPTLDVAYGIGHEWLQLVNRVFKAAGQYGHVGDALGEHLGTRIIETLLLESHAHATGALREPWPNNALERALFTIHAAQGEPVGLQTLAAISGVTGRSLQQSFRDSVGMSPMAYQLRSRLERVRNELLFREPASTKIADIAAKYGFTHLGRFAAQYAREFDERPSDTLRR